MNEPGFSGKFQQPVERFTVQYFDYGDLNRLPSDLLLWTVVAAVVALGVHFFLQRRADVLRRKQRK
jgi:hypothetical protein